MQATVPALALLVALTAFAMGPRGVSAQGYPTDPYGGYQGGYGTTGYGTTGYGSYPQSGYPQNQYGTQYGATYGQYGYPSGQYGYPGSQYGATSGQYGYPNNQYGSGYGQYGYQYQNSYNQYGQNQYSYAAPPTGYPAPSYGQTYYGAPAPTYAQLPSGSYYSPCGAGYPYAGQYPGSPQYNYGVPPGLGAIGNYCPPPGAPPIAGPGGAFNVTATPMGNSAMLNWSPLPGAVNYNVWQAINNGSLLQTTSSPTATASVAIAPGNTYVFQVHAIGPSGFEIGVSNITPPLSLGGPTGYPGAFGQVSPMNSRFAQPMANFYSASQQPVQTFQAQVRDVNNNPVASASVFATVSGPAVINGPSQLMTDGLGNAYVSVRAQAPGPVTVSGTANQVPMIPSSITFGP